MRWCPRAAWRHLGQQHHPSRSQERCALPGCVGFSIARHLPRPVCTSGDAVPVLSPYYPPVWLCPKTIVTPRKASAPTAQGCHGYCPESSRPPGLADQPRGRLLIGRLRRALGHSCPAHALSLPASTPAALWSSALAVCPSPPQGVPGKVESCVPGSAHTQVLLAQRRSADGRLTGAGAVSCCCLCCTGRCSGDLSKGREPEGQGWGQNSVGCAVWRRSTLRLRCRPALGSCVTV